MRQIIILDRDGTLIVDVGYINDPQHIEVKEGVIAGLRKLLRAEISLIIVSNQSGVPRKIISDGQFNSVHQTFLEIFDAQGISFERIYYCFHLPSENCLCRKPNTDFMDKIVRDFGPQTVIAMVGDSIVDAQFAKNAKIPFYSAGKILGHVSYDSFEDIAEAVLRKLKNVK